jgi:GT2 family glycosyltransferase
MTPALNNAATINRNASGSQTATDACVSILIPAHNCLALTKACLESIFAAADASLVYEIIVIDDVSTDGTAEYLTTLGEAVRTLRNPTRQSFAESLNRAAPLARGEFLCFLNNDTVVLPGWLESLLAASRTDPARAIIGNRQLSPGTGRNDHAGVAFNSRGQPMHLYAEQPADFWPALVSGELQAVTGACWLIAKATFLELGGFDTAFRNGYEVWISVSAPVTRGLRSSMRPIASSITTEVQRRGE